MLMWECTVKMPELAIILDTLKLSAENLLVAES